jgi:hypothetical protein
MITAYAIFSSSEENNLDPERASEAKYTRIFFSLPSSYFSCTKTALAMELQADKYS